MLSDRQFHTPGTTPHRLRDEWGPDDYEPADGPDVAVEMWWGEADRAYETRHAKALERKRMARGESVYEQGPGDPF